MANKYDGIIEAVRYKNGQITLVRAYERRGSTFSDWLLIDRETLLERLKKGVRFMTGSRENLLASTFNAEKTVAVVQQNGQEWIATRQDSDRDDLEQVPFF